MRRTGLLVYAGHRESSREAAMRFGAGILLAICGVVAAAPEALAAPLTIMVEDASEPFSRPDGSGYANDLVRAAYKAAGIEIRFNIVPYARCKRSLEMAETPACFSMSWVPEFQGRIVFADHPLFVVHADVFTRPGGASLGYGSVVGIVNGYEYPAGINDLARRGVSFMRNIDEAAGLRMLARGRLDAAVVMTSEFENMPRRLAAAGVTDKVAFAWRGGLVQSHIGFNPAHPRGAEARAAFNRGYAIIRANHVRDRIRDDWMKAARR